MRLLFLCIESENVWCYYYTVTALVAVGGGGTICLKILLNQWFWFVRIF